MGVLDLVTETGDWNWERQQPVLPREAQEMIEGMLPPSRDDENGLLWASILKATFLLRVLIISLWEFRRIMLNHVGVRFGIERV